MLRCSMCYVDALSHASRGSMSHTHLDTPAAAAVLGWAKTPALLEELEAADASWTAAWIARVKRAAAAVPFAEAPLVRS